MSNFILWLCMVLLGTAWTLVSGYHAKDAWDKLKQGTALRSEPTPMEHGSMGNIYVTGNTGSTQVSINSPGSQQTINKKRVIRRAVQSKRGLVDGLYVLTLTFQQSDGIWNSGTKFWMQLQLTGPYTSYEFKSGISKVLHDVDATTGPGGNSEAARKGWIELKTSTAPLNEPIVLEIRSKSEIGVGKILLEPTEEK